MVGRHQLDIHLVAHVFAKQRDAPGLNYQLACYHALAGRSREAIKHLKIALEGTDGRVVEWAREDEDLDSIRADPDFPKLD